ncbi:unknown [Prevotella sp. CAG:5226]|nr:unknown [Prevotella sp. CAG:5226]
MQWKMGVHTAHHIFSKHFVCTLSFYYCCLVKRKNANELKHQTLPLMGATRLASGIFQQYRLAGIFQQSRPH